MDNDSAKFDNPILGTTESHSSSKLKHSSLWIIICISVGAFLIIATASAAVFGVFASNEPSQSTSSTPPMTSEEIDEMLAAMSDLSNAEHFDQDTIAQLSQEFLDANVDIVDPDAIIVPPTLVRENGTSIYTDDFFGISIEVPYDRFDQEIYILRTCHSWVGANDRENSRVFIQRTAEIAGDPNSQIAALDLTASPSMIEEGFSSTILESGVVTFSGAEYVYIRHYENLFDDVHIIRLARSINGTLKIIQWSSFDIERSTLSIITGEPETGSE